MTTGPGRTDAAATPIGLGTAVALVMGSMIGSGIFLLPASLAPFGARSLIGWTISSLGALALALVFARLARLKPASGGPYAYTRQAFGDLAGFLVAWGYWISMWSSLGALAVAFVGYLDPFVPWLVRSPPLAAAAAIATVWVLIGVNMRDLRSAGRLQVVTTVLKILPLLAVGLAGLRQFDVGRFADASGPSPSLLASAAATATLTLWAFLGLEAATVPAGAIRDPGRTIPRATVIGTVATAAIYITSTVGVMVLLPAAELARSTAPFADAARALAGPGAAAAVALGAAISCFGALNGWVLLVGQLPIAVAADGLFPRAFARVSRRGTPDTAMVVAGLLATGLVAANYSRPLVGLFTFIILLSTLNTLVPYAFSSLAVFLIPDPAARGGRLGAATVLLGSFGFVYSLWTIGGAGAEAVYWGFLLLVAGLPVYVWVQRARSAGVS